MENICLKVTEEPKMRAATITTAATTRVISGMPTIGFT